MVCMRACVWMVVWVVVGGWVGGEGETLSTARHMSEGGYAELSALHRPVDPPRAQPWPRAAARLASMAVADIPTLTRHMPHRTHAHAPTPPPSPPPTLIMRRTAALLGCMPTATITSARPAPTSWSRGSVAEGASPAMASSESASSLVAAGQGKPIRVY